MTAATAHAFRSPGGAAVAAPPPAPPEAGAPHLVQNLAPAASGALQELHARDPRYGFDKHKGYATREHLDAVARFGYSDVHRRSFRPPTLFDRMEP